VSNFKTIKIDNKENLCITFLYNTLPGRVLLNFLVRPFISAFFFFFMDMRFSKIFIHRFVKQNDIDLNEYENEKYKSFNDFFSRKIKENLRPFPDNENDLASPCDGKLSVYPITDDGIFNIKNSVYDITGLLRDKSLADEYVNGFCLIFRLTPDDYHRYTFIDDGELLSIKKIKGILHTVRPISHRHYKIYAQNYREYIVMQTANFGKVIQMEVGALFVGRIKNHVINGKFKHTESVHRKQALRTHTQAHSVCVSFSH
jgi:phosphatidylserine decarboxylase